MSRRPGPTPEVLCTSRTVEVRLARMSIMLTSGLLAAEGDRLRSGFGALKNEAARAAVLALMQQLLARVAESAEPRSD